MSAIIEIVLIGLFIGGVYGLLSLGLSIIFSGIRELLNIAHGHFALIGSYLAYLIIEKLRIDPLVLLPLILLVSFCLGFALQQGLLNKVVFKDPSVPIMMLLGVALIIENTVLLIFSPDTKSLAPFVPYSLLTIKLWNINVPIIYLICFSISIITILILYMFMKFTFIGRAIRATSENYEVSQGLGVNYKKIYAITFGIGSCMASLGGLLIGLLSSFNPSVGFNYLNLAFGAFILGGMGSIRGCLVGGIIIGLVQSIASYYISTTYAFFISNVLILIVLAFRPQGLFGYKV